MSRDDTRLLIPDDVRLAPNHPNPFRDETTIRNALPAELSAWLVVYDVLGREVAVLVDDSQTAGGHTARWDAGGHASRAYVYRLAAGRDVLMGTQLAAR